VIGDRTKKRPVDGFTGVKQKREENKAGPASKFAAELSLFHRGGPKKKKRGGKPLSFAYGESIKIQYRVAQKPTSNICKQNALGRLSMYDGGKEKKIYVKECAANVIPSAKSGRKRQGRGLQGLD